MNNFIFSHLEHEREDENVHYSTWMLQGFAFLVLLLLHSLTHCSFFFLVCALTPPMSLGEILGSVGSFLCAQSYHDDMKQQSSHTRQCTRHEGDMRYEEILHV